MAIDPYAVWANMRIKIWPERYWLMDLSEQEAGTVTEILVRSASRYSCVIRDQAGLTAVVDEQTFENLPQQPSPRDRFGPFRIVSTDGELPFDVIGFLQPVLLELNAQGIKAGPQCGAVFDHLFIYEKDIDQAERILLDFIEKAKKR